MSNFQTRKLKDILKNALCLHDPDTPSRIWVDKKEALELFETALREQMEMVTEIVKKQQGDPFEDSDDHLHGIAYCKANTLRVFRDSGLLDNLNETK